MQLRVLEQRRQVRDRVRIARAAAARSPGLAVTLIRDPSSEHARGQARPGSLTLPRP